MKKLTLLLALALAGGVAQADNLLINGGFEGSAPLQNNRGDANSMALTTGSTYLPGWRVIGPEVAWIGQGNPYNLHAAEGERFVDLTGWLNQNGNQGGLTQTIQTVAGQQYVLEFDLGSSSFYNWGQPNSLTASAGNASQLFSNTNVSDYGSWQHFSLNFTATGNTTEISFVGNTAGYYIGLDNARVTAAVPEIETWAGLLAGLGALGLLARRRKQG
ncbi:DUF642 domain-containing protein [Massilia sp. W12]|uniref:DUF642 domain-containing protein n=1 Tax=Massilia sp. W12 TaxID=3126507 RepID=UPI0030CE337C